MRTALLLLSFFTAMLCHAQKNLADFNLKGRVRSVYTDMEMPEKRIDTTWHIIDYREFNEQGQQTVFIMYHSSVADSVVSRTVYTYNPQGKIVADTTHSNRGAFSTGYAYNEKGLLSAKQVYADTGITYHEVYSYNGNNLLDTVKRVLPSGITKVNEVYLYNGKYPAQKNVYDSLDRLTHIYYYLDTAGNKPLEEYYLVKNTDTMRLYFTAVYAPNGEWLVHQYFFALGGSITYQKQVNSANETMAMTITDTHRSKKTVTTNSYLYIYDNAGNWIKATSQGKGRPDRTTTRTITYY